MITKGRILLVLTLLILRINEIQAQFSGAFAPANWGTVQVNSDGITNASGAPASIYMVSGDNSPLTPGMAGTNDYSITIPQNGLITFSWSYSTNDGPQYDWPEYVVNGVATLVNGFNNTGLGSLTQGGSQPCIPVTAGQVFRFRMYTADNYAGPATCIFSNFAFSTGNLTISPASPTVCPGNTLALTASGGGPYSWSGGITNGGTFTPVASAVYTVTSGTGACTISKTVAVAYNPPLTISGPTANICANSSATLIGQGGATYTWNTGAVSPSIVITPSLTTSYTISGISSQGCNTDGVKVVTVDPGPPVLTATASSPGTGICPGKTLTLNGGGAASYTWTGGIPTVTNGIAFPILNTTTFVVTGTNSCGSGSTAITVSVHPLPLVTPIASTPTLCAGSTLTLTGIGTATSYVWSGGSLPITNGAGFIPPVSMVVYSVIGTSALSCTALATVPATVYATPVIAPVASPTLICLGGSSTLSAQGATTYSWSSSSQTVFTPTFVVTPSAPGISTYTITKANSNCADTKVISVITNSLPGVFTLASPGLVCALQPATISVAGGQSYTWTAPGTPTYNFNGASVIVYPQTSTLYTVAASDGTCITVTTLSLSVDPNPTISIASTSPSVCLGQSVTLTASGGNSYTWTTPSGTLTGSPIQVAPAVATAYTLTGSNSFGCTAEANQVVLVFSIPNVGINVGKAVVCNGGVSTLTASGAGSYTWSANANSALTPVAAINPTALVTGPVIYSVTGADAVTGCTGTQTTMVTVYIPTFAVTGNTNTCQGGMVTLTGAGASSYTWNTGSGSQVSQALTATVTAPAVYTVNASATSSQVTCSSSQTIAVGINANPNVTAVAERTTICKGEFVEIRANGATTYTWQSSGASNGATLTVSPQNLTNNYVVTGTDANGCVGTGTTQVKVSLCTDFAELNSTSNGLGIYPNPNNGEFTIQYDAPLNLLLINQLGQVIRTLSLSEANGYKVSITDVSNGIYLVKGQIENSQVIQKVIVSK